MKKKEVVIVEEEIITKKDIYENATIDDLDELEVTFILIYF